MASFLRLFRFPATLPRSLQWAAVFYLTHLICQAWIASSEIALAVVLLLVGYAVWQRQLRVSFHIVMYPLAVFALASTLSAFFSDRRLHAFGETATWLKFLLFPCALILFREAPRVRELSMQAMLVFGAFISAFGLFQYFGLHQRDLEHRITGPAAHVMTFSGLVLPVALVFLVLALYKRSWWLIGGTLLTTVALLMTFTRSVWIGWLLAVLTLLIVKRSRWIFYAAPLLLIFISVMPLSLFGRLISTFDTKQESNLDRIRMVQAGVEIIKDYPLFGVGPANVKEVYPLYRKPDAPRFRIPHLHDNVVQIWAERGVVALVAYLALLGLFVRSCAQAWRGPRKMYAEIGIVTVVSLTAAGLFEFNFGDTEVQLLMLDIFALVLASMEPVAADARYRQAGEGGSAVNEPESPRVRNGHTVGALQRASVVPVEMAASARHAAIAATP